MDINKVAYKTYRIYEDAEIQNTSDGNWRYAEQVVRYFDNKDEFKEINRDLEELFSGLL
jgi:hypothetical protein